MIALANAGTVGEEDHVELAALGRLGAPHIMLDVQRAVGRHVGVAPGGRVITMAADRQAEPHPACRHHSVPLGQDWHRTIRSGGQPQTALAGSLAGED